MPRLACGPSWCERHGEEGERPTAPEWLEHLRGGPIDEVITTNSVPADWPKDLPITVLSIAPLLSDAIRRIHGNNSVTDLFPIKGH